MLLKFDKESLSFSAKEKEKPSSKKIFVDEVERKDNEFDSEQPQKSMEEKEDEEETKEEEEEL